MHAAGIKPEDVEEVILGNVVSAGIGQAPARQASMFAGRGRVVGKDSACRRGGACLRGFVLNAGFVHFLA